jgi:hypothetical protein
MFQNTVTRVSSDLFGIKYLTRVRSSIQYVFASAKLLSQSWKKLTIRRRGRTLLWHALSHWVNDFTRQKVLSPCVRTAAYLVTQSNIQNVYRVYCDPACKIHARQ